MFYVMFKTASSLLVQVCTVHSLDGVMTKATSLNVWRISQPLSKIEKEYSVVRLPSREIESKLVCFRLFTGERL
jgi:hypothetical protein